MLLAGLTVPCWNVLCTVPGKCAEKGVVMKRTRMMVIAVASLASAAFAFQKAQTGEMVTHGEIVAVSTEEGTVALEEATNPDAKSPPEAKRSGVRREFVVNEATKMTAADARIELDDIDVGQLATVRYVMDSGRNVAVVIEVRSPTTE